MQPNAEVDYVDAATGALLQTLPFYDPGLDEKSWLATELKKRGMWQGPQLSYGSGRRLSK